MKNRKCNTFRELLDSKSETIQRYRAKLQELRVEYLELVKKEEGKVHNERGAGRKSKLTQEQLDKVNELHKQGLSYNKIGQEVGISKAYVYKLINY